MSLCVTLNKQWYTLPNQEKVFMRHVQKLIDRSKENNIVVG